MINLYRMINKLKIIDTTPKYNIIKLYLRYIHWYTKVDFLLTKIRR